MLFESGVVGHLTGSYDAGGSYGLETLEVVGSEGRVLVRDACESLEFYPRRSPAGRDVRLPRRHDGLHRDVQ